MQIFVGGEEVLHEELTVNNVGKGCSMDAEKNYY